MQLDALPQQGQDVLLIANDTDPGRVFPGSVARPEPFTVRLVGEIPRLLRGSRTTVLYRAGGVHHKLGCEVLEWSIRGDSVACELEVLSHEELERRRSQRVAANLPCMLTFVAGVQAESGQREATVLDLSQHGAGVVLPLAPEAGTLFHLVIPVEGEPPIRALTVCTRRHGEDRLGLQFVDLIGGSDKSLKRLLSHLRSKAA